MNVGKHRRGHSRQPLSRLTQDIRLEPVLDHACRLDDTFGGDQAQSGRLRREGCREPLMPADREVSRFEPHFPDLAAGQRPGQHRVIRSVDEHQFELRAGAGPLLEVGDRRLIARVGDEQQAVARDHDDRRAAGKVGQVGDVRQRGDDQRTERALGHRPADLRVSRDESGGRGVGHTGLGAATRHDVVRCRDCRRCAGPV
jgi:hypothetical protein